MVEAPGTAPGSETLMSRGVYRHSRLPDTANIGALPGFLKAWCGSTNFLSLRIFGPCIPMAVNTGAWRRRLVSCVARPMHGGCSRASTMCNTHQHTAEAFVGNLPFGRWQARRQR